MNTALSITPADSDWIDYTGKGDLLCLKGGITILGCPMHVEAHAVRYEDGTEQVGDGDSDFDALYTAFECDGVKQTVTIRGREYVLFAHAYGA